ncbi:MAG: nucleotide pyrophosphohydrolase [Caldilineaceae bacterium]
MSIAIEAAEIMEHFQWLTVDDSHEFMRDPANRHEVADELADVLIYCLSFANATGVDVSEAVLATGAQPDPLPRRPGARPLGRPATAGLNSRNPVPPPTAHSVARDIDVGRRRDRGCREAHQLTADTRDHEQTRHHCDLRPHPHGIRRISNSATTSTSTTTKSTWPWSWAM